MNKIINQLKQLTRNLWILLGICLLTTVLTIVGAIFSGRIFISSYDKYMQEFYDGMTGGIIPLFVSGTAYLSKYLFGVLLVIIPIAEFIILFVLLIIALLFQIGLHKKWKVIVSNVLVGLVNIVKIFFIVYLSILIYLTYKVSYLISALFLLQIIISLVPIVLSFKLIYKPSYQTINEPLVKQD